MLNIHNDTWQRLLLIGEMVSVMEVLTQLELMSNSAISGFVKLKDMSLHVSIECILKEVELNGGWWYIRRRAQNIGAHIHRRLG